MSTKTSASAKTDKSPRITKAALEAQIANLQERYQRLIDSLQAAQQRIPELNSENQVLSSKLRAAEASAVVAERHHQELHQRVKSLEVGSRAASEAFEKSLRIVVNGQKGSSSDELPDELSEFVAQRLQSFREHLEHAVGR
ncbi:MAG: hypothetical protein Q7S86_00820 [bacterium]|nr:hypothetical protein [bacterium]